MPGTEGIFEKVESGETGQSELGCYKVVFARGSVEEGGVMTLIDATELEHKLKLRRDRITHNLVEIERLLDQNQILMHEIMELSE